jgi:Asp-tRNA(Asn)/Glu-tRNA(Gln) amidotransferase A subunit family amidase
MRPDSVAGAPPTGELSLMNRLTALERYFAACEPSIHAFIPEADRFSRLRREAESIDDNIPDSAKCGWLPGRLVGIKDIFRVDGFATYAGSQLPADEFQGEEAESVTRLKSAGSHSWWVKQWLGCGSRCRPL